ncbi:MAG: hypothetical protein ACOYJB_03705 [Christensenellaceae bacterium]|jgi:hypothetical protein
MKKTVFFLALILLAVFLGSCSISDYERYNDFLADLDVYSRMDIAFYEAAKQNVLFYTKADLATLEQDLATLDIGNEDIVYINTRLLDAVGNLCAATEACNAGNTDEYEELFKLAENQYAEARLILSESRTGRP